MSPIWLTPIRSCSRTRGYYSVHFLGISSAASRCFSSSFRRPQRFLTLAIETSCDDTCVAVLEKDVGAGGAAYLRFNKKITSDNREFRGVDPMTAVASHTQHLANLIKEALHTLPEAQGTPTGKHERTDGNQDGAQSAKDDVLRVDGRLRRKPDFVTVTRGPGMMSNLSTGLNTAKGLAVAWDVPLLGVNHMQAHALTPRLVSALQRGEEQRQNPGEAPTTTADEDMELANTTEENTETPSFPFLSLLVSGGHTLLLLSRSLNHHTILAEANSIAIGDMLDKCAREIVPPSEIAAGDSVMYGPVLERFAFPEPPGLDIDYEYTPPATRADEIELYDSGLGWGLTPPLHRTTQMAYEFAGINGQILKLLLARPDMPLPERRLLARHAMRLAFEHLASRLLLALKKHLPAAADEPSPRTLVLAGGVASNRYLVHILRSVLDARGHGYLALVRPPASLCTDNAAMIAWTGMEMYEAGWRSELDVLAIRKWSLDPEAEGGGILGAGGWARDGVSKGEKD